MTKLYRSGGAYKGSRKRIQKLSVRGNWTPAMAAFASIGIVAFATVIYLGLTLGTGTTTNPAGLADDATRASTTVHVTARGFEPSMITVQAGTRAELTFIRTTEQTCGTEISFPSLNIRRPLPMNQPVTIDVPAPTSGVLAFECGMRMLKGTIVAQ